MRNVIKSNWIWICIILLFVGPTTLNACPFCAGQDNKFSDILVPVTFLLGAPFAVAGVFIAVVMKNNKKNNKD